VRHLLGLNTMTTIERLLADIIATPSMIENATKYRARTGRHRLFDTEAQAILYEAGVVLRQDGGDCPADGAACTGWLDADEIQAEADDLRQEARREAREERDA
jgi:hypothetical protein